MGLPHCMNGGPILVVTSIVRYRYWFALMSDRLLVFISYGLQLLSVTLQVFGRSWRRCVSGGGNGALYLPGYGSSNRRQ
jgi:hypothetical protein